MKSDVKNLPAFKFHVILYTKNKAVIWNDYNTP